MKIAYCLNSIKGGGGIERVTIQKANSLAEIEGNQVYVLVTDDKKGHVGDVLNEKVTLIDLDINYYEDDWQGGWRSKVSQFRKKKEHKKILRETLNRITPDIVIAVGQSEKFFLIKGFLKKPSTVYIRELHFATRYRTLLAKNVKERLLARLQNFVDFKILNRNYDAIVCLTPQDVEENWKGYSNVHFVPNPLTVEVPEHIYEGKEKKIITLGRLTHVKNYPSLIRAFAIIASCHPDWILEIYGSGTAYQELEQLIGELRLEQRILLMGHTHDVSSKLENASIFVLSSITEGFPLVLLEAMSHGLPVVSYDCPFGPSFIIEDGKNGILVPLNDETELASSMEYLIQNEEVRHKMALKARLRAAEFMPQKIADQWMSFFNDLRKQRK